MLSSTESEYIALSEAAKEIKFVAQVLMTLKVNVKLPITVYVDNIGAIFMAENINASSRTRHTHIHWRYITEFIDNKFIKICFVKSIDNLSDGLTKNTSAEIYEKHKKEYVINKQDLKEE